MIRLCMLFAVLITSLAVPAQSNWVTKKVGNELSVKFPQEPTSDTKPEKRLLLYTVKLGDSGCLFTVLIRSNAMSGYEKVILLPASEKEKKISTFLDKGISQFILDSKIISASKAIKIGDYNGREITYSQFSDKDHKWITQHTRFVFAKNNLYIIQCSSTDKVCDKEKNIFLNSITPI